MSTFTDLMRNSAIPAVGGAIMDYLNITYVVPAIPTLIPGGVDASDFGSIVLLWITQAIAIFIGVSIGAWLNGVIMG